MSCKEAAVGKIIILRISMEMARGLKMVTMGQKEHLEKLQQMMSKGIGGTCACGVRVREHSFSDSLLNFSFHLTFPLICLTEGFIESDGESQDGGDDDEFKWNGVVSSPLPQTTALAPLYALCVPYQYTKARSTICVHKSAWFISSVIVLMTLVNQHWLCLVSNSNNPGAQIASVAN
ncbi:hypothetical protein E2542_SST15640 [Spatholobus suberectus]|nr:hypothetical protein E2542_SST15640 [Spatholobus suberectus]